MGTEPEPGSAGQVKGGGGATVVVSGGRHVKLVNELSSSRHVKLSQQQPMQAELPGGAAQPPPSCTHVVVVAGTVA